jgi:hypothetical protein
MWDGGSWTGLLRTGTGGGYCKRGNEPSGSIKCGEFLDKLRNGQLLNEDATPWSK